MWMFCTRGLVRMAHQTTSTEGRIHFHHGSDAVAEGKEIIIITTIFLKNFLMNQETAAAGGREARRMDRLLQCVACCKPAAIRRRERSVPERVGSFGWGRRSMESPLDQ